VLRVLRFEIGLPAPGDVLLRELSISVNMARHSKRAVATKARLQLAKSQVAGADGRAKAQARAPVDADDNAGCAQADFQSVVSDDDVTTPKNMCESASSAHSRFCCSSPAASQLLRLPCCAHPTATSRHRTAAPARNAPPRDRTLAVA
jgi:hypothetical protein